MKNRNQTTLFFIRHGQTESNNKGIIQGDRINDPLNNTGTIEAQALAKITAYLELDIIFTSYLQRAEQTADIIEHGLIQPVQLLHDFRLHERDFGTLSGKNKKEVEALLPDYEELERLQTYNYRPFGGENVDDVRQRAVAAILDICENYWHNNIGIVTHSGIIRLMLFHFPDVVRIFHPESSRKESQIANTDLYQWEVTAGKIENLKSLLKKS
jgi:probable phosphoglycerate mutase